MMADLLTQLRANARLRVGLALIIAIAWLYGVLTLRDEVQAQSQRYRNDHLAIARLTNQLAEPEWPARASTARALAVQMEGRLWQAPTPGLAQAAYQDWLTVAMVKAGITAPQVTVTVVDEAAPAPQADATAAPDALTDVWKLKARVLFEFNPPALMDFLAGLENHERQSVVRQLTVRREPSPRVEMELTAYFQKQGSANGNNAAPAQAPALVPAAAPALPSPKTGPTSGMTTTATPPFPQPPGFKP